MTALRFHQLDVFTDVPLAGNPLAVFPDGGGLDTDLMQRVAREMNLSETVFVAASDRATARLRIFTPTAEVPLAGHPVIGTWWLLAELGRLPDAPGDGTVSVTQETGRGILPVEIVLAGGAPTRVTMTQAEPEFGPAVTDTAALARALGCPPDAIGSAPGPEVVSTALPQMIIPIGAGRQVTALPSGGAGGELAALLRAYGTDCAMCYALDGTTAHCRMFAPGLGVPEDPATGSAAGALGAYLARHGLLPVRDGVASITVRQGDEIGRPSVIHVTVAAGSDGAVGAVRVGGTAVRVIEGEVTL